MAGIVIVAHTPIASALKNFAEHVYGQSPDRMVAVDVPAHEDAKVTFDRVTQAVQSVMKSNGVLVLTDIFGATPANVAAKVAKMDEFHNRVVVLTGVNLPMLLRVVSHRTEALDELAEKALQGAQQGMLRLRDSTKV